MTSPTAAALMVELRQRQQAQRLRITALELEMAIAMRDRTRLDQERRAIETEMARIDVLLDQLQVQFG